MLKREDKCLVTSISRNRLFKFIIFFEYNIHIIYVSWFLKRYLSVCAHSIQYIIYNDSRLMIHRNKNIILYYYVIINYFKIILLIRNKNNNYNNTNANFC